VILLILFLTTWTLVIKICLIDIEHADLLLENHFDYVLSGCRLLGRDLKGLSLETQNRLNEFFDNKILMDNLAISITQPQIEYDLAVSMLHMIKQGFND
jgi:hypothetical protein